MADVTRRRFISSLACTGLCVLASEMLGSCRPKTRSASQIATASPDATATLHSDLMPTLPGAREALYYSALEEKGRGPRVRCELCPRLCALSDGQRGECSVRENRGGVLYTLVYGRACAVHADPIEKKPLYHFLPGSLAFSIATAGCNLHCLYCQNWQISQRLPEEVESVDLPPEQVVSLSQQQNCPVVAYTYSEPTVFYEYMLDTATLGRSRGLRNAVISAGYISQAPLLQLCQVVDAIKIDFKGYSREFYHDICGATLQPVLETMKTVHQQGVHLEIVTLVVPTLNDQPDQLRDLCRWIVDELGPDVPIHFSRFHPLYKLTHLPMTPVEVLEQAREIAMEQGIRYSYIGNVPGHAGDNTYCHHCGKMLIRRLGFSILENCIVDGKCEYCNQPIPGVWL